MIDKYKPVNIFKEIAPSLSMKLNPVLAELDRLLDDDKERSFPKVSEYLSEENLPLPLRLSENACFEALSEG